MYYVYILKCADDTYYTGYTSNLEKRVKEHNSDDKHGAKYTKTRRPVELLYSKEFSSKHNAMSYEWHIKHNLSRSDKERLICGEDVFKSIYEIEFNKVNIDDDKYIKKLSRFASRIVKEHFDPIIGPEQNDYMISLFQTPEAIKDQLSHGYNYYVLYKNRKPVGFLAYVIKEDCCYLSKFYIKKNQRGLGLSRYMLDFVISKAKDNDKNLITLNVNRNNSAIKAYEAFGFEVLREEKNDIGNGYYMDDYVYGLKI